MAKYIVESDVIIYDLHFGDIREIEFVLKGFQQREQPEEPRILILISSILVWDGTPKKIKTKKEEENAIPQEQAEQQIIQEAAKEDEEEEINKKEDIDNEDGDSENEESIIKEEKEKKKEAPIEYEPFKEENYLMRAPKERYQYIKDLEDLVLSFKWPNVKTYVICPGIFYGRGELVFKEHFKVI